MKVRMMAFLAAFFLVIGPAVADEALSTTEATTLIKDMMSQAQTQATWIPAGTIVARHEEHREPETTDEAVISKEIERQLAEYKSNPGPEIAPEWQKQRIEAIPFNARYWMSNAYTMVSTFIMHYDGSRFYCEKQVESRTDSVQVPSELKSNPLTEDFRMAWNGHRIIAWDGQDYTTYDVEMDHAFTEPTIGTPAFFGGPFTAGILHWGEGILAEDNLAKADVSAVSVKRDGITQIEMAAVLDNGSEVRITLDPSKDNAVTLASLPARNGKRVHNRYFSGYQQIDGHWVPTTVLIEVRDAFTGQLISSDKWDFLIVDPVVPAPEAFSIDYGADTRVQFESALASATFNHSNLTDTDQLLAERLDYVADKTKQRPRNCATVALKYAASRLGKTVSSNVLDGLVGPDGQTSLSDLKQAAENMGLRCRAVATDVATLKKMTDCIAILYLPGKKHFAVLDRVDDRYVWVIDLASTKMYYRVDVHLFPARWAQGIALLISNRSIDTPLQDLSPAEAKSILGAVDGWSCTNLMQEWAFSRCIPGPDGCTGYGKRLWNVYGCEPAEPNDTCDVSPWIRKQMWECKDEPGSVECAYLSTLYGYYMEACYSSYY